MKNQDESSQLDSQTSDYVTLAIKGILGAVPFAGSLLGELVGTTIPNQRIDRIARFAELLEKKLAYLEQDFVHSQLANENFSDLFEDSLRQAAHSLSDERREYISSLIVNSLSQHDIEFVESKQLMRILGEINDIEIIWLKYYLELSHDQMKDFQETHSEILNPVFAVMSDKPTVFYKEALQKSYKDHLVQLNLLQPIYEVDRETQIPIFDRFTGEPQNRYYRITNLGRLLLEFIGLYQPRQKE